MSVNTSPHQHLRSAGELLVAAVYALRGHTASWPLQPAPYDLIAESAAPTPGAGARFSRVRVKTCTRKQAGAWLCWITRSEYCDAPGGKRRVAYTSDQVDELAVVDGDLQVYVIPFALVAGQSTLTPRAHDRFRVAGVALAEHSPSP